MTHLLAHYGLSILFILIMLESFGLPLPGETALITFSVFASQGKYSIFSVIIIAALGAIIGDNLGYYFIGRLGGRTLFTRWRWLRKYGEKVLPQTERLIKRHGGKTVFFGRFIAVLRYTAAWVAGLGKMPWKKFLFWNASGGIIWATLVGFLAFTLGHAAIVAYRRYGFYALILVIAISLLSLKFSSKFKRYIESHL